MGGWMPYDRVRGRNGLPRADDPAQRYSADGLSVGDVSRTLLRGDLDRMEDDYLTPEYPQPPGATRPERSSPAEVCALATGLPVQTVRLVLAFVFRGQVPDELVGRGSDAEPPTTLRAAIEQIEAEAGSSGLLQPGAAFALGCLGCAADAGPGATSASIAETLSRPPRWVNRGLQPQAPDGTLPDGHPLPWDQLVGYERDQQGYWLYLSGEDAKRTGARPEHGEGTGQARVWVPVRRP